MVSYKILFKPSVEKDFSKLPKTALVRALGRIEALAQNPFPPGSGKLAGAETLHRLRVGEYRIIYEVDVLVFVPSGSMLKSGAGKPEPKSGILGDGSPAARQ